MSKKLSQSEIDALVASLLAGDASGDAGPAQPEEAAPSDPQPTVAEIAAEVVPEVAAVAPAPAAPVQATPAPAIGLTAENMPFELVQDLGPITQAEVETAIQSFANRKAGVVGAPVLEPMPSVLPLESKPAAPAAAAAMVAPAPTPAAPVVPTLPSQASYAASQAQAAQQTRKALSMAALRGVLLDLDLTVTVELGRAHLSLSEVLALGPGSVVTLEKLANTPVDVRVNGLSLAKAEVLAIGEKYGIRITQSNLNTRAAS